MEVTDNEYLKSAVADFGTGEWTLRDFVDRAGIGVETPVVVGSGATVADELLRWAEETDIDGFNITNVITPGTFAEVAEHVVPELQRRGVYKTAYRPGTLREKLFGRGARLPDTHLAARHRRTPGRRRRLTGPQVETEIGGGVRGRRRRRRSRRARARPAAAGCPSGLLQVITCGPRRR